ncbi:MAG: hypothetical protein KF784_14260 [Fimbriimonadaceae bacterium]|nr:hypothetical protein [Fimbriimonadaceae bacterium]
MQSQIFPQLKDDDISAYVIWTPSYGTDNATLAEEGFGYFKDKRVKQYWDTKQNIALAYGAKIKLPRDAPLAYDVYFIFPKGQEWGEQVPIPKHYMHQVIDGPLWFDPKKFLQWIRDLEKA